MRPLPLAALALLLAPALALLACSKRSAPEATAASAATLASAPPSSLPVIGCYDGCMDLNKGKPIDQAALSKNCATKCVRVCSKSCASFHPYAPREQTLAECKSQCEAALGAHL